MKVVAAVRELENEGKYSDRVTYDIVEKGADANYEADCAKYDFGAMKHGLVVLAADGTTLGKLDGHNFSKGDIAGAIEKALGS